MEQIEIRAARFGDPAVKELIGLAMAELSSRYGGSGDDTPVAATDFDPPGGAFFVAVSRTPVADSQPLVTGGQAADSQPLVAGGPAADSQPLVAGGQAADSQVSVAGGQAADSQVSVAGGQAADSQVSVAGGLAADSQALVAGGPAADLQAPVSAGLAAGSRSFVSGGMEVGVPAGERLVGCGGWRRHGEDAELKRMFTIAAARGRGVARRVLAAIEESAREQGCKRVILETGDKQPEAIALYEKCGYERIEDFGYYKGEPGVLSYARTL